MNYFPIMKVHSHKGFQVTSIPWSMIAPCERQAISNHSQDLAKLASRGGLSVCEALAVLDGMPWAKRDLTIANQRLNERVEEFNLKYQVERIADLEQQVSDLQDTIKKLTKRPRPSNWRDYRTGKTCNKCGDETYQSGAMGSERCSCR